MISKRSRYAKLGTFPFSDFKPATSDALGLPYRPGPNGTIKDLDPSAID